MTKALEAPDWRRLTCMVLYSSLALCVGFLLSLELLAQSPKEELLTVAESSQFKATSTSAQVEELIGKLAAMAPHITAMEYGKTVEGRPMTAVVCANPPFTEDRNDLRGVALVIGNIHAGECDGKEAILMLLRELAEDPQHRWLEHLVLVFVPNFNADGNDQMAPNNRPGQVGPEQGMGRRTTAEGFDLNRDFMKLDSPEGRAMVRLIDRLDPDMFIDCHTTNGSKHQYQLTYDVPHHPSSPENIRQYMRQTMMPTITERLWQEGIRTFYYGNFDRGNTTWTTYGYEPRYSTEYLGLRGKFGVLSESYSYLDYEGRIKASRAFVSACLDYFAEHVTTIRDMVRNVRQKWLDRTGQFPNEQTIVLNAEVAEFPESFLVKGFEDNQPKDYVVKFLGRYVPTIERSVPYAYLVPRQLKSAMVKLQQHGIEVEELTAPWSGKVEAAKIKAIHAAPRAFQGHRMVKLDVEFSVTPGAAEPGDWIVRTAQPLGAVAAYLLEPESNDGLATWNYLDEHLQVDSNFPILRIVEPSKFPTER